MKATLTIITLVLIHSGSAFNLPNNVNLNKLGRSREQAEDSTVLSGPSLFSSLQQADPLVLSVSIPTNSSEAIGIDREKMTSSNIQISSNTGATGILDTRSSMKRFTNAIFTVQDAPIRFHASSSAIFTFGGGAWLLLCLASLLDIAPIESSANVLGLDVIFGASWGLIISGLFYMPKSKRYEHYRRTFIATSAIMGADTMLWYWFSHIGDSIRSIAPFVVPVASFAYGLALMGEIQFVANDDNNRQEALDTGLISAAIAAPVWKYLAIAPTHFTTASLKTVGIYHMLVDGIPWLEENPKAAAFGSALYMSNMVLAAWSAFTQGTMTIRRTPAFGKQVFRLENDFVTWSIFAAVFVPLIVTVLVGYTSGSLQEYFSL